MSQKVEWSKYDVCNIGKCRIDVDQLGRPIYITHGRTCRVGLEECRDYLASRQKLKAGLVGWWTERSEKINEWKHTTPHFRYSCDGGSLAVMVNDVIIRIGNGIGDGSYPIYADIGEAELPPTFRPVGISIDGPAVVEPLSYDCGGGEPLTRIELDGDQSVWFYADSDGAIAIRVLKRYNKNTVRYPIKDNDGHKGEDENGDREFVQVL